MVNEVNTKDCQEFEALAAFLMRSDLRNIKNNLLI